MIVLTKDSEVLKVSDIEDYGDIIILTWGQYRRSLTTDEFNQYVVTEE